MFQPRRTVRSAAKNRAWPRLSGAYLLHARKRVRSLTPVRMRNRLRTAVIGGLAEPAARRAS